MEMTMKMNKKALAILSAGHLSHRYQSRSPPGSSPIFQRSFESFLHHVRRHPSVLLI